MQSMTERAELVGGSLQVRSQPGAGTTIVATVPVLDAAAAGNG
jgi:signal transduction histidine kinase